MASFTETQTPSTLGSSETHWFGPVGRQRLDSTGHAVAINAFTDDFNGGNAPWTVTLALSEIDSSGAVLVAQTNLVTYTTGLDENFGFDNREVGNDKLLAVWSSAYQNDPNATAGNITAQFFQDDGTALTSSKILMTDIANLQDVHINAGRQLNAGFYLTYSTYDSTTGLEQINYQRYDNNADPVAGSGLLESRNVGSTYQGYVFSAFETGDAANPDYLFAETSTPVNGSDDIAFKVYDSDLSRVIETFTIDAAVPTGSTNVKVEGWGSSQLTSSSDAGNDYETVASITYDDAQGNAHGEIDVHTFDLATHAGTEIQIPLSQDTATKVSEIALSDGSFVIEYTDSGIPYLQDVDNAGQLVGQPTALPANETKSTLTLLSDDELYVTYRTGSGGEQQFNSAVYRDNVACYCTGTRISTAGGERRIEELAVGDAVITASGVHRPVVWIGRRHIDTASHPDPRAVWPVRVSAGAFDENLPGRDLWMSPGHNVLGGGVLMPVRLLVNGATVVQVPVRSVTYWHVELDSHDVILAEGLPAESYLDIGNRTAFANGGAFIDLHPDFEPRHEAETCAPLCKSGLAVQAARAALLARAADLGYATTAAHDLHLVADGRRIEPIALGSRRFAFAVPAGCGSLLLASDTFVPRHVDPASQDGRVLGVSVKRLQVDGQDLDLAGLAPADWHGREQRPHHVQRWTKGAAALPAGARLVAVALAGDGCYWRRSVDQRAVRQA